jgi:quercetin dioxygenase-like cupin family protein
VGKAPTATLAQHNAVMALAHAQPFDTIDVRPLGGALVAAVSSSLLKSSSLQLMRVVLRRGETLPEHHVPGEITVHCIEGKAVLSTPTRDCALSAGELVLLPGGEPHALRAVTDTSLLVTLHLAPYASHHPR